VLKPISAEAFYRRAAFLPLVLPVLAAGLVTLMNVSGIADRPGSIAVADLAGFIAIAGVVGIAPYGLWAVIAVAFTNPTTERDYRRMSWFAPGFIAFPFGLLLGLLELGRAPLGSAIKTFTTFGILALGVGYAYAVVVNLGLLIAKRMRCVQ